MITFDSDGNIIMQTPNTKGRKKKKKRNYKAELSRMINWAEGLKGLQTVKAYKHNIDIMVKRFKDGHL